MPYVSSDLLLAHASCHVANYQFEYCAVNVGVWAIIMLPKMPFMNGVRIFGINRTTGIDDNDNCGNNTDNTHNANRFGTPRRRRRAGAKQD